MSGNGNNVATYTSGTCMVQNNGEWTIFTVTYSGSAITFLRNGQNCSTQTTTIKPLFNSPEPLRIGGGNNIFFNGAIDDVFIYNKELPDHQLYRFFQESEHGLDGIETIPVLLYHNVTNGTASEPDMLRTNDFRQQIDFLHNNNFTTITAENFNQWKKNNFTMPARPVIIYFDDGVEEVYSNAYPILKNYGYVGTVAVVINDTNGSTYEEGYTGFITWPQALELQNNGWDMASHSMDHDFMTSLNETEFRRNLNVSSTQIKQYLGRKPTSFVFPFHDANATYTAICGEYYDLCWTYGSSDTMPFYSTYTDNGHEYQNLKRITIYNTTTIQTFQRMFIREISTPVGAWPLNEGNGSKAYDRSGNNNDAILNANATWHQSSSQKTLTPSRKPTPMPLPPTEKLA